MISDARIAKSVVMQDTGSDCFAVN